MNTQFLTKSMSDIASHSSIFSFGSLSTRSLFLAAGDFSRFFSVSLHLRTRCLCKAEMDIDNPGSASQRFCLISERIAAGYLAIYSIKKLRVNFCQPSFASNSKFPYADKQASFLIFIIFLDAVLSCSDVDTSHKCRFFGSFSLLNH